MKYLLYLFLLGTMACQNQSENYSEQALLESPAYAPIQAISVRLPENKRVMMYNASLTLQVRSIEATYDSVKGILEPFQAYASNENLVDWENRKEQSMEIRVVERNFVKLLDRLEQFGEKTVTREVEISDVTSEYIDLGARLKTKKELENRYYEILKQAKTVKDMLEIESQLGEVREEIESMESRIKYIDNKVSYSTIRLTFSAEAKTENSLLNQATDAIESGWNNVIQFFLVVLSWWPWLVVMTGLLMMILRWRKRRVVSVSPE